MRLDYYFVKKLLGRDMHCHECLLVTRVSVLLNV